MFWLKLLAGLLLFYAIGEGFPYLAIENANGDPLLALENYPNVNFGLQYIRLHLLQAIEP